MSIFPTKVLLATDGSKEADLAGRSAAELADETGYEPTGSVEAGEESLPLLRSLARAAVRCSMGRVAQAEGRWIARGDPMEAALDVFARRLRIDVDADEGSVPVTKRFPFDPARFVSACWWRPR